jgi:hypothetical protein
MKEIQIKTYPHFDAPLSKSEAVALVSNPLLIAHHPFYPFLQQSQHWTKFPKDGKPGKKKDRPIRYAARRDSYILSYYRSHLYPLYERTAVRFKLAMSPARSVSSMTYSEFRVSTI